MRTWWVAPEYLCRQRLLGQHREIHMLIGAIQKKQMQSHPLTKYWQRFGWNSVVYYHGMIVKEMRIRGYNGHTTQPEYVLDPKDSQIHFKLPWISDKMIQTDIEDLLGRWERHGQHGAPRKQIPDRATKVETIWRELPMDTELVCYAIDRLSTASYSSLRSE